MLPELSVDITASPIEARVICARCFSAFKAVSKRRRCNTSRRVCHSIRTISSAAAMMLTMVRTVLMAREPSPRLSEKATASGVICRLMASIRVL